jgi:hypothetical protein
MEIRTFREVHMFTQVRSFNDQAFQYSSLEYIEIPDYFTSLPYQCFRYGNLKDIDIPASVSKIGEWCFGGNVATLETVIVRNTTPPTIGSQTFRNQTMAQIYVPSESVEAYKSATYWSNLASRIHAIED